MVFTPSCRVMSESEVQLENALSPMQVTRAGILTWFKLEQDAKEPSAMVVRLSGNVTVVSLAQPLNISAPVDCTPSSILTEVSPLRWNAQSPISVTFPGISIESRLVQESKAYDPMEVRLLGRVTVYREEQESKAWSPIFWTLPVNESDVRKRLEKAYFSIDVIVASMVRDVMPQFTKAESPIVWKLPTNESDVREVQLAKA